MAGRVEIPVTEITRDGVQVPAQVTSDATNDHFIAENDGTVELEIENVGASDHTVTVKANPTLDVDGLAVGDLVLTIPYGETWKFGPFRPNSFRQDASGMMHLDPSASTDLKFRAFKRQSAFNSSVALP